VSRIIKGFAFNPMYMTLSSKCQSSHSRRQNLTCIGVKIKSRLENAREHMFANISDGEHGEHIREHVYYNRKCRNAIKLKGHKVNRNAITFLISMLHVSLCVVFVIKIRLSHILFVRLCIQQKGMSRLSFWLSTSVLVQPFVDSRGCRRNLLLRFRLHRSYILLRKYVRDPCSRTCDGEHLQYIGMYVREHDVRERLRAFSKFKVKKFCLLTKTYLNIFQNVRIAINMSHARNMPID